MVGVCKPAVLALALAGALGLPVRAQSPLSLSGQVDFGFRAYTEDGLFAGQSGAGTGFFIGAELNAGAALGAGDVSLQFAALSDARDGRSVLNLKRAYYSQVFDSWDMLVGYNVENWGVAESRSILNVINPVSATDLSFGQDTIGTPMINANFSTAAGTLGVYALVGFTQPDTPDRGSRGRGPWGTYNDRAVFQEGNGRNLDVALRFSGNYALGDGALDVSALYFNGTSRQAVALPGCGYSSATVSEAACRALNDAVVGLFAGGSPAATDSDALWDFVAANATDPILRALSAVPSAGFVPYYQKIQQVGLSAVYARGDLQLRFEGIYREPKGEDSSFAAVIGGDYTWPAFADGDGTLTLAVEYLYDGGDSRQPTSIFENDVFLGLNYLLNDTRDTRLQLGGFYDLDSQAQLYQLSLSSRLNDSMRAELSAVHVKTRGWNDPLAFIADDNFIELKFSAFF